MNYDEILDFPYYFVDCNANNLRGYFRALLTTLWREDEGFSGKRPFGNSGWCYDVYAALVKSGAVYGIFEDETEDELESFDKESAIKLVYKLIDHVFKVTQ
jgi:hypothetical protein